MSDSILEALPPPPPGKVGWPWTEESRGPRAFALSPGDLPTVTIVTPSFNQGRYLEATIRSVLLQRYPRLEYFVLDGGSTDGSDEILARYSKWITWWVSAPDRGQSDAILRGLEMGTGELAGWVNSDDLLHPDALLGHASAFGYRNGTIFAGDCIYVDEEGEPLHRHRGGVRTLEELLRVPTVWRRGGHLVQPEVLFPRRLALEVGGVRVQSHFTMDYELWGRLLMAGASIHYTGIPFAMFRRHPEQKTSQRLRQTEALVASALGLLGEAADLPAPLREELREELDRYLEGYRLRRRGRAERLQALGVPLPVVRGLTRLAEGLRSLRTRGPGPS
jgi:hypothetical protein